MAPVIESEFEFKLLSEIDVDNLTFVNPSTVKITLAGLLNKNSNYMLMILKLKNAIDKVISLDEDLHTFTTDDNLVDAMEEELALEEESTVEEELNAALKETEVPTELEEVALYVNETPDTGAETSVLIILTFLINIGILVRKKL